MNIEHNLTTKRFFIELEGGTDAELKYRLMDDNSVDFYSTFVPNTHRGQGIASALVKTGIAWAKEQNYDMHASCWYARKHLA
ncbi:MAG: GNAT family N-acetyltransferase [Arenicella sp.]